MQHDWKIFTGSGHPTDAINRLPEPPPWRQFKGKVVKERNFPKTEKSVSSELIERGKTFLANDQIVEMVNAALYLRRPLLVTGKPGTGKSSLIYRVAYELMLGEVLEWPITSRTTLQQGLYQYDAIGRLQESQLKGQTPDIGKYLKLGALGTALLPTARPRALLIDEIDKADLDLPNDLLNIFEKGEFRIPELERLDQQTVEIRDQTGELFPITNGYIRCSQFPFVVMTSNGERDFPAPLLRRCLQLTLGEPDLNQLELIVEAHLGANIARESRVHIQTFLNQRDTEALATDQLLNALFLVIGRSGIQEADRPRLIKELFQSLTTMETP
ncbi:MAG: MoxR family ATPase [Acidobacteria bacterium]|nr:MoxR family ATPase [Acidobacteriota bacterium]